MIRISLVFWVIACLSALASSSDSYNASTFQGASELVSKTGLVGALLIAVWHLSKSRDSKERELVDVLKTSVAQSNLIMAEVAKNSASQAEKLEQIREELARHHNSKP